MDITNPILRGFNPDPSILRVGDDYYIAMSRFEWYPGAQIHHSKDGRPQRRSFNRLWRFRQCKGLPTFTHSIQRSVARRPARIWSPEEGAFQALLE